MSSFAKLIISVLSIVSILYLFTATSFLSMNQKTETINQKALVEYITNEVNYELQYGDENFDLQAFVDQAMISALKKNKK